LLRREALTPKLGGRRLGISHVMVSSSFGGLGDSITIIMFAIIDTPPVVATGPGGIVDGRVTGMARRTFRILC
jgi:hypothetical protein